MIRDHIIVPQNRSFQASLSGHPPRRRKLLLRWTAPQALQSLPLHKKFYACRKYKEKLHQTSKQNQRVFAQNRMYKNVHFNRKPIFFLRSESRRSRLTRVPCWCQRFSYTIKMCNPKTPSRFREVIQLINCIKLNNQFQSNQDKKQYLFLHIRLDMFLNLFLDKKYTYFASCFAF